MFFPEEAVLGDKGLGVGGWGGGGRGREVLAGRGRVGRGKGGGGDGEYKEGRTIAEGEPMWPSGKALGW